MTRFARRFGSLIPWLISRLLPRILALALTLVVVACGFQPLHKKESAVEDRLTSVLILPIADRSGQILHNMLRDELNPTGMPADPGYKLSIKLAGSIAADLGTAADNTANKSYTHVAKYVLYDARNNREIYSNTAQSRIYFASYASVYDNKPAEEQAAQNGLRVLSREIYHDLASLFSKDTL